MTIPVASTSYTHIQFRRFSGCQICNTHIAELRRRKAQLDAAGIHEVLFFSLIARGCAAFHSDLPFDGVGDREKHYYRQLGVESSWSFVSPSANPGRLGQHFARQLRVDGNGWSVGLPAEFLLEPDGRIKAAHHGKHAYDQWSVEILLWTLREIRGSAVSDCS